MSVSYRNTSKTTAFSTLDVLDSNTNHQFVFQAFESTAPGTPLNPSSGTVVLKYRPLGSTAYITYSSGIDLSSGPNIFSLSSRVINSIQITHTHGSSTLTKLDYYGWRI